MPNKVLLDEQDGTPVQISFADHAGDFAPASNLEIGTPTDVQLSLASVGDGAARKSAAFDLGAVRAPAYHVRCAFELAATPLAGDVIELYVAPGGSATGPFAGGVTAGDAAYSGYSSNLADSVKQLIYIGAFVCTVQATGTVQIGEVVGLYVPPERHGILVAKNESGAVFHSDDVESHVVMDPVFIEVQ